MFKKTFSSSSAPPCDVSSPKRGESDTQLIVRYLKTIPSIIHPAYAAQSPVKSSGDSWPEDPSLTPDGQYIDPSYVHPHMFVNNFMPSWYYDYESVIVHNEVQNSQITGMDVVGLAEEIAKEKKKWFVPPGRVGGEEAPEESVTSEDADDDVGVSESGEGGVKKKTPGRGLSPAEACLHKIEWASIDPYECIQKIGRGKYSEVFRGRNRYNGELCVLKVLKPVKSKKIYREITILQHLFNAPYVIKLLDTCYDSKTDIPVLVFENVNNVDFRALYPTFTPMEIRYYMFKVLRCLDYCHSVGISHRDLKPQNIMIDRTTRKLRVIDWGLGEYYIYRTKYNVRVASRYYKGPELLVGYNYYDYSLDCWSLGCIFAGLIFMHDIMFQGADNNDQLLKIMDVLGSEGLIAYVKKYKPAFPKEFDSSLLHVSRPKKSWESFITSKNESRCDPAAIDLLSKLLVYDHAKRILPREAMMHPYFDAVREEVLREEYAEETPQPAPVRTEKKR